MLIQHARHRARFAGGDLVLLADQDRSLWDGEAIVDGRRLLDRAIALRGRGQYVLQAAIASLQLEPEPDWLQISGLYERLIELTGSEVVKLNHAVAVAQAGDPSRALELIDRLALDGYSYMHSARGELLARLGRSGESRCAFERALALSRSEAERRFLENRLSEL
jgi:RNA polymerase sigma-70 factor (ECF subfamily)